MTSHGDPPLRVGVLTDSEYVQRWQQEALAKLVDETAAEITTVVINDSETHADQDRDTVAVVREAVDRVREYPLWSLAGIARMVTDDPAHEQPVHIDSIPTVPSAKLVPCAPVTVDEYWDTFPSATVENLAETDVIVRFGFGMIKGEILDAPTYGVLSYHMGDIREYRGQPGGFWEFLNDERRMGVTVQRLTDTLDGGEIAALSRFDIDDANTWQEIWRRAHREATQLLVPAVRTITDDHECVSEPDELGALYSLPEGIDVLRYLRKNTRGRLRNQLPDPVASVVSLTITALALLAGVMVPEAHGVLGELPANGLALSS